VTGESYGAIGSGYATLAYDAATGDRLWLKRYEFNPVDNSSRARSIAVSPDGKTVFVTGESAGETHFDYATLAYDASTGHTRWERRYDGSGRGAMTPSLAVSPDGTAVFVTGESNGSTGLFDYGTVAYDASTGHKLWDKRYDGPASGNDSASSIGVSPDGTKVFVTGSSVGAASAADYETLAYDASSGDKLWAERYNGPANSGDYANSIAVSPGGTRVFVTGMSRGLGSCRICDDYATIAYAA
jgi:outer membrane protein assembly factor BamB